MKLTVDQRKSFYTLMFPALIEQVLLRAFHIIDSMMVGQMENSTPAVAAVGLCGAPINLIVGVSAAFFIGTTATVAWYKGAKNEQRLRDTAYQSMLLAGGIALVMTLLSIFGARTIMSFVCGSSSENLELAVTYYRINAYGFFFQIVTANITACFRGIGVSKLPMVYNLTGGGVNVIFNYLLIFGPGPFPALGVAGAAWATTISKAATFIFALLTLLYKKGPLQPRKGIRFLPDRSLAMRLIPIGITAAGEQLILQSGATLTSRIIATLPTASVAANQVVNNLEAFAWTTGAACNTASTSLFGQAMGAGNEKLGRSYLRLTLRWALLFSAVEMLLMLFCGRSMAALFTNDSTLYGTIAVLIAISALAMPFVNIHQSVSGALRGAGDSLAPLISSLVSLWIFRVGLTYLALCVWGMGAEAIRWCIIADQAVRCLNVSIFYLTGHWRRHLSKSQE